jgi:hypothetical protein
MHADRNPRPVRLRFQPTIVHNLCAWLILNMTKPSSDEAPGRYWLLFCFVAGVLCLPVLWTRYAPLVDYPNHLARAYILRNYANVPAYRRFYVLRWGPIPNLAIDLVAPFLLRFFSVVNTSRIFLSLTVVIFATGCHLLGKAIHGRPTWLALPCAFFVYNSMFLYGFVNYVFGLGLGCISLGLWLRWRKRWTPFRFAAVSGLVICAYLAHLTAYGFVSIGVVIVIVWAVLRKEESLERSLLSISPILPPSILFLAYARRSANARPLIWNNAFGKVVGALSLFSSYNRRFDAAFIAAIAAIVIVVALRAERTRIVWPTFVAGTLFALFFLASPKVLMSSFGADVRFVPMVAIMIVLSIDLKMSRTAAIGALLAVLTISSIRVGLIWRSWMSLDRRIAAEVGMFKVFPDGASVYPVFLPADESNLSKTERAFEHTILYATINEHVFVPTLFAIRGQQPLQFRVEAAYQPPTMTGRSTHWADLLRSYDFAWSYRLPRNVEQVLASQCTPVASDGGFTIWRIEKKSQHSNLPSPPNAH